MGYWLASVLGASWLVLWLVCMRQRRQLAELEKRNAELDRFAHSAAHDLREPLRGLKQRLLLLQEQGGQLEPAGLDNLHALNRLAQRLDAMIEGLLRCAPGTLQREPVDLDRLVDGLREDLQPLLAEKNVDVRVPRPLPTVQGDPLRLGQLWQNLIVNAIRYNDKAQPWIEIGWSDDSGVSVFHVRDNGIGIPGNRIDAIFAPFRRLHARDEFGGGIGLGLALARSVVEEHAGRLWVESTPGAGSTFFFTLGR